MFATLDGKIVDPNFPQLSLLDRGFLFGDGIFETLRIYGGHPFKPDEHVARLRSSAKRLGIPIRADISELIQAECERASKAGLSEAYLRLTVSRGAGLGLASEPQHETFSTIVSEVPVVSPNLYVKGAKLIIADGRRNEHAPSAGMKTTSYADSILALRTARAAGSDDVLFLDNAGHISEASASNIFFYSDNSLFTPPLSCGVLPGITRQIVIEIARSAGWNLALDKPLETSLISAASEIFLTSSVREIMPVTSINDAAVGGSTPGRNTVILMQEYSRMTHCTYS